MNKKRDEDIPNMQRVLSKYILREPLDALVWRADIEFAVHPRRALWLGMLCIQQEEWPCENFVQQSHCC